jgi:predicted phosphodiesterase
VPDKIIRIISDVHYGDHASRVRRLAQLRPLLEGVTRLVLNGDTLDTRPAANQFHSNACRDEVLDFFPREVESTIFLSGNHDADFSPHHSLDLAGGAVFVIHGDILFDNIVPWGRDAALVGRLIATELRALSPASREVLENRLVVWRRVAASIPQRHQSERNRLKYALHFAADTVWPPLRIFHILRAWHLEPIRAATFARQHRPAAGFILIGHTHRPGVWRTPAGVVVINTGSFCRPLGGCAVDVAPTSITVRRIDRRGDEFHPGGTVAEFPLARA